MVYVFDIDGTICTSTNSDYESALPLETRIEKVNQIYDAGHTVIFLTARGMGRSDNSIAYANKAFYNLTKKQLDSWGIKYHALFLGKPAGDFYIDDKGTNADNFFTD
tara:strand:- start:437 stop:757 length:321 start_codon:yes stop_codon:yes gene_type:complete